MATQGLRTPWGCLHAFQAPVAFFGERVSPFLLGRFDYSGHRDTEGLRGFESRLIVMLHLSGVGTIEEIFRVQDRHVPHLAMALYQVVERYGIR